MGANCGKHLCKGKHDCGSCGVQQSKWEVRFVDDYMCQCTNCGFVTDLSALGFTYCPNCGAKMKGQVDAFIDELLTEEEE